MAGKPPPETSSLAQEYFAAKEPLIEGTRRDKMNPDKEGQRRAVVCFGRKGRPPFQVKYPGSLYQGKTGRLPKIAAQLASIQRIVGPCSIPSSYKRRAKA